MPIISKSSCGSKSTFINTSSLQVKNQLYLQATHQSPSSNAGSPSQNYHHEKRSHGANAQMLPIGSNGTTPRLLP